MKKLNCHCGEVQAEVNVSDKLEKVLKCNCSICKRRGAIMSIVKNEDFKIIKGKDKLKLYQFLPVAVFTHITIQELILH